MGELLNGIMDEFNSMSVDAVERRNRRVLSGVYAMAATGATVASWGAMLSAGVLAPG